MPNTPVAVSEGVLLVAEENSMDKDDRDVDKGIKKLLIGRAVVILLVIFAIALVTGMYIMGFSLPLWYFFD